MRTFHGYVAMEPDMFKSLCDPNTVTLRPYLPIPKLGRKFVCCAISLAGLIGGVLVVDSIVWRAITVALSVVALFTSLFYVYYDDRELVDGVGAWFKRIAYANFGKRRYVLMVLVDEPDSPVMSDKIEFYLTDRVRDPRNIWNDRPVLTAFYIPLNRGKEVQTWFGTFVHTNEWRVFVVDEWWRYGLQLVYSSYEAGFYEDLITRLSAERLIRWLTGRTCGGLSPRGRNLHGYIEEQIRGHGIVSLAHKMAQGRADAGMHVVDRAISALDADSGSSREEVRTWLLSCLRVLRATSASEEDIPPLPRHARKD